MSLLKGLIEDILKEDISDNNKIKKISSLIIYKEYPNEFKIFWDKYNIKKDKGTIYKKFNTILRAGNNFSDIMEGLNNYIKSVSDKTYLIQPRRFLNEKVWLLHLNKEINKPKTYLCAYGTIHKYGEICNCD